MMPTSELLIDTEGAPALVTFNLSVDLTTRQASLRGSVQTNSQDGGSA